MKEWNEVPHPREFAKPYKIKNTQGSFKITPQKHYSLKEKGIASFYGDKFHGRKTASGVCFNQWDMTCAHPRLPLPSIVKVSIPGTKKEVVLIATDRGPFVKKGDRRIIDLSRGAARILGIEKQGVANVEIKCLEKESAELKSKWPSYRKKGTLPFGLVNRFVR
ncbi:septal ring lytic transglycosylase RlpA family protein [Candidatus Nesciobacter abundans]|uniref:septal ring lytic transglycosylase RlpA family protein n=1 Tax=Candidatus Nesciobacter abundans TaxID=2601668 RepID=UPI001653EDAB|nr:septal ring lytic transglycosylase RlpA family protein [Candidatus Nesciobacter abundans]